MNMSSNVLSESSTLPQVNQIVVGGGLEYIGKRVMNMTAPSSSNGLSPSSPSACANNRECLSNWLNGLSKLNDTSAFTVYEINTLHNRYVFFFCYFMAMCSVCYNPIVYFWMHKKFRQEVRFRRKAFI